MRLGSLLGRAYITPPFFQKYRVLIVALVKFCLHGLHCPLDLAIGLSIQWRRCDMFEPPQSCKLFLKKFKNFVGCKLKAVVSDKGIAYTMSTKHFLHSQDGLSSIDTSRYKTDFNVAWVVIYHKQVIVTFMDEEVCCNFSPWSNLKRCTPHGLDLFYSKLREHVAVLQHLLDVTWKSTSPDGRGCIFACLSSAYGYKWW